MGEDMKAFFSWADSLGWQASLCFVVALAIAICIAILLIDATVLKFIRWLELRAIGRRFLQGKDQSRDELEKEAAEKAAAAKREADSYKWGFLAFPYESGRRIPRRDLDPAHRTGQFSVPHSMLDKKGITR
jgi:hypothetical protein